jgi:restriction system protein
MVSIWGIHNNQPDLDLVANGFVSIGWDKVKDLSLVGQAREELKALVAEAYPSAKPGAIPVWAGVMQRFAFEAQSGDVVIYPNSATATLNFGRLDGSYYFDAAAEKHKHRRKVVWLQTDVPRTTFSKSARYEIGAAVTMFRVKNHAEEFAAYLSGDEVTPVADAEPAVVPAEVAAANAEDEPNADRLDTYTRDFILETLHKEIDGYRFEHFVAHLLRLMGYRTQVTQASGDGGFDIIAHRDPLGLEPPIIKVQCKRTLTPMGAPEVQKLTGALAPQGAELGLFVTLGTYSKDAQHLGRLRQDLRLVTGTDLVDLVLAHYESFDPEWKRLLPLRRVYLVDREPEAL